MRTIEITQRCAEELLLNILKADLKNAEDEIEELVGNTQPHYDERYKKLVKKDIKTLKRAINFYSVEQPYDDV